MTKEKIPVEVEEIYTKDNGNTARRVLHSYVALLTEMNGSEVKAVRLDRMALTKGLALSNYIEELYPGWNIKGIWRLYEDDFRGNSEKD